MVTAKIFAAAHWDFFWLPSKFTKAIFSKKKSEGSGWKQQMKTVIEKKKILQTYIKIGRFWMVTVVIEMNGQ